MLLLLNYRMFVEEIKMLKGIPDVYKRQVQDVQKLPAHCLEQIRLTVVTFISMVKKLILRVRKMRLETVLDIFYHLSSIQMIDF